MRSILLAPLLLLAPAGAIAAKGPTIPLVLENHRFEPAQITVPAGQAVTISLSNKDASADEFDSSDLGVEEDVTPHGHVTFGLGPLKPGVYHFMGEAHAETAQGVLTVTP